MSNIRYDGSWLDRIITAIESHGWTVRQFTSGDFRFTNSVNGDVSILRYPDSPQRATRLNEWLSTHGIGVEDAAYARR